MAIHDGRLCSLQNHRLTTTFKRREWMSDARKNRGTGNGGDAYRSSSFWDAIEKKKQEEKKDKKS
jgi:hypothetical protein